MSNNMASSEISASSCASNSVAMPRDFQLCLQEVAEDKEVSSTSIKLIPKKTQQIVNKLSFPKASIQPTQQTTQRTFHELSIQQRFIELIDRTKESWTYAIFWQSSPDNNHDTFSSVLKWGDGYFKGEEDKARDGRENFWSSAPEQEHRKRVFLELDSLIIGSPTLSMNDLEDVTDTQWWFMCSMTQIFVDGSGLPGQSFSKQSPVWIAGSHRLAGSWCERARKSQAHGFQTLVFIPLAIGVIELASTELLSLNSAVFNEVKVSFNRSSAAVDVTCNNNPYSRLQDSIQPFQQPSVQFFGEETIQELLIFLVDGSRESWTYAIFWHSSFEHTHVPTLTWGDGYYYGETTKSGGKRFSCSIFEQEYRKRTLQELNSLIPGQHTLHEDNLEDISDTEWFFLVSMTQSFINGIGLPGQSFSKQSPLWIAGTYGLAHSSCERAIQSQTFGIQTLVYIPLAKGVVELASTELFPLNTNLFNEVKLLSYCPAFDPSLPGHLQDGNPQQQDENTKDFIFEELNVSNNHQMKLKCPELLNLLETMSYSADKASSQSVTFSADAEDMDHSDFEASAVGKPSTHRIVRLRKRPTRKHGKKHVNGRQQLLDVAQTGRWPTEKLQRFRPLPSTVSDAAKTNNKVHGTSNQSPLERATDDRRGMNDSTPPAIQNDNGSSKETGETYYNKIRFVDSTSTETTSSFECSFAGIHIHI